MYGFYTWFIENCQMKVMFKSGRFYEQPRRAYQ